MTKLKLFIYIFILIFITLVFNELVLANSMIPDGIFIEKDQFKNGIGDQIGIVENLKGQVIVIHGKQLIGYMVYKNMPLYVYDMIVTLKDSAITIKYNDGTYIVLMPESRMTNVQFNYDLKTTRSILFDLETGKARFQIPHFLFEVVETVIRTSSAMIRDKQPSDSNSSEFFIRELNLKTEIDASIHTQLEIVNRTLPETEEIILNELERAVIEANALTTVVSKVKINEINSLQNQFKFEADETDSLVRDQKSDKTGVYVSESAIVSPDDIDENEIASIEEFDENKIEEKIENNEKTQQEQQSVEVSEDYSEEIHEDNIKSMPSLPSKPY